MQKILLADDDQELCDLLKRYLSQHHFDVTVVHNGQDAIDCLQKSSDFNLLLLDISMPGMTGLDVLRSTRASSNIPTMMLTGRNTDVDRIVGLDMGADDYVGKPCSPRELLAHIHAVLRRAQSPEPTKSTSEISIGDLLIDRTQRHASIKGNVLDLTGTEFNTLLALAESRGEIVSKEDLSQKVLYRRLAPYDRSVDVHVSRVRKKLKAQYSEEHEVIKSVRGQGYVLVLE